MNRTDTRYCRRFDGREIVRRCVDAHSEYLVMWVRDGDYAYYDSKLLPKAPGLGDRDPLQETMEEAQKHDLPVIAYCVVQQGGHFLDEHPQYEMRDSQGNRIGRFCYNSGYLDVMKAIVAEQLAYGIAGFHIDMVDQGFGPPYGCWCDQCRKAFQDQYGCAMPEQVTWDRDWDRMLEFRYATSQRFEKALYRHIKKLKPRATVDFNYHGNPPFSWEVGRDHPETYFQSFQGAHKALVYGHIPWSIVLDENVTAETLKRTPVVLLPNAGILSEREVGLLHDYVEGGGNLILTGLTACYDRMGNLADASGLEELTGAGFVAKLDSLDNWVRFKSDSSAGKDEGQLRDGIAANWPFLVKGPGAVFRPEGATAVGELLRPYRTTRQLQGKEGTEWPMSADSVVGPAMLVNRVGRGTVLTYACSPGYATAGEHHIVEARRLLVNAIRLLCPEPRVRITAPTNVQAVVSDEPSARRLRVHLLGYNAPPQTTPVKNRPHILPGLIEDAPMYRVVLEFADEIEKASTFTDSTELRHTDHRVSAIVNDVHEVIVVDY